MSASSGTALANGVILNPEAVMMAALADPHYGFPYLSRVGHLIFKAAINAGRSCDNNGRFRKNISSTREVVRGIAESA